MTAAEQGMERSSRPRRVLFVCTHNSARSQMAEASLRQLGGDRVEVASAGTEATRVHPLAIRVMDEVGVDLRSHTSKTLDAVLGPPWDYVVTVCDSANERCPLFPGGTTRLHWSFDDPSRAPGSEKERLAAFQRVRDEIAGRIRQWLPELDAPTGTRQERGHTRAPVNPQAEDETRDE